MKLYKKRSNLKDDLNAKLNEENNRIVPISILPSNSSLTSCNLDLNYEESLELHFKNILNKGTSKRP